MKKKSLQATCKDLKNEVTKAASMVDYNIKAKHMDNLSSFFASKNFELVTRLTPPAAADPKAKANVKSSIEHDEGDEANKAFVCSENIEKDREELDK